MTLPDYADWLTPERLAVEERLWERDQVYVRYVAAIEQLAVADTVFGSIVEFGCGTGYVATALDHLAKYDPDFRYIGYDRNEGCLERARAKNANRRWASFVNREIRTLSPDADLVCGFAVLKHFRLDEWPGLFARLFRFARNGLFTIPIAAESKDDGTEFTHVWLSESDLSAALARAGHVELWRDTTDKVEPIIATRRL